MVVEVNPPPISAVIISRDAEQTISTTLEYLAGFAEVVVYDNGSQDRTIEVARSFANVRVHEGEFLGFLDGWRGLAIAVGDANGIFFKYMNSFADANDWSSRKHRRQRLV